MIMAPYFMYKVVKGEVQSKLFDSPKEPKNWYDSPKAAKAAVEAKKLEKKLEKANDNSAGFNQQLSIAGRDTSAESDINRGNELGRVEPIKPDASTLEE
jgi:hypothetical protein